MALAQMVEAANAGNGLSPLRLWSSSGEPNVAVDSSGDGEEDAMGEVQRLAFHRAVFDRAEVSSDEEGGDLSELDGDGVDTPAEWLAQDEESLHGQVARAGEALDTVPTAKRPRVMASSSSAATSSNDEARAATSEAESAIEVPSLSKEARYRAWTYRRVSICFVVSRLLG